MSANNDPNRITPGSSPPSSKDLGTQELSPGVKLKGRYLIERELGRGGVGIVYLARDERLHGMPVVIKFLLDAAGKNDWLGHKFLQEAEALTRINHPGVVRVIDRDQSEHGHPFFVMEFVPGSPLRSVVRSEGTDFEYAAALIQQIGAALQAAHAQGIVHRDLKPENILIQKLSDGSDQIKLIDFGIAKVRDSQAAPATEVAILAGSLQYISPEQLTGAPVSTATDIYALGIVAYELLTGRRPFNPDAQTYIVAAQQLLQMQQAGAIVPPKQLRPSLPGAAQSLIMQSLAADPAKRPQDARDFGLSLAQALTGPSASTPPHPLGTVKIATEALSNSTELIDPPVTGRVAGKSTASEPDVLITSKSQLITSKNRNRSTISEPPPAKSNKALWAVLAIAALALLIVAGLSLKNLWGSRDDGKSATTTGIKVEADRILNYSVSVQKDPRRYPGSKPFQLPGEVIFSPGDRVRFSFASAQAGHLYIINESPEVKNGAASFNILFPSPTSNGLSAQLSAGQTINIPERGDGFIFDEEQGAEKLWLVWSANQITEIEAVKRFANPQDKGEIKDSGLAAALQNFLNKGTIPQPETIKDEANKSTQLKGKGDLLIKLIKLEHH